MSDYTVGTVFASKDALSVNDPDKKVVGSELDGEFTAIATAIATKENATAKGGAGGYAELNGNAKVPSDQVWANMNSPAITTSAITMDCGVSNQFYCELTENITVNEPGNPVDGQTIWVMLKQDGTGSRTVTWNAIFRFAGGSNPTMTATASKADLYVCTYNATLNVWFCVAHQNFTVT